MFYDHVTLHSPCSQLPSFCKTPSLAPQLSRVGPAPLSTNPASPPPPCLLGFQELIVSISNRFLLIFLQNVFHDFTDITTAATSGSLVENAQVGLRAPQWLCVPTSPPHPSPSRAAALLLSARLSSLPGQAGQQEQGSADGA